MFYDPSDVRRAASLLLAGAVLNRSFQPYESHVPYLLQLKIDLNLQGMGYLNLGKALFRGELPAARAAHRPGWAERPVLVESELDPGMDTTGRNVTSPTHRTLIQGSPGSSPSANVSWKVWVESTVPMAMRWTSTESEVAGFRPPQKTTTCDLELDGKVEDVLNRQFLIRTPLKDAGADVRMVESLAPMWEEERIRCGGEMVPQPSEVPRTPQQLNPAVAAFREQFEALEIQIKDSMVEQQQEPPPTLLPMVQQQEESSADQIEAQRQATPNLNNITPPIGGGASAGGGSLGGRTRTSQPQPLFFGTQAANELLFPSQAASPGQRQARDAEREAILQEDYGQFVDTNIVMTQLPVAQRMMGASQEVS